MKEFGGETPINMEQKCPCILVLDTSSSMAGKKINELNNGLRLFQSEIAANSTTSAKLEVCILAFNHQTKIVQEFILVDYLQVPNLVAQGSTKMVDAIRVAIGKTKERKKYYKKTNQTYYRPYIILITDGEPDPGQDIHGLQREIETGVSGNHFHFWAFGVSNANMRILDQISHRKFPPKKLKGSNFINFFTWLSSSMSKISNSRSGESIDISPENHNDPFQIEID